MVLVNFEWFRAGDILGEHTPQYCIDSISSLTVLLNETHPELHFISCILSLAHIYCDVYLHKDAFWDSDPFS